jgi:hypothetical protein
MTPTPYQRIAAAFLGSMAIGLFAPTGCGGVSSNHCRFNPEDCHGAAGTLCDSDLDCNGGLECCTDNNNCGDGMCTLSCDDDNDCPHDMLCEHNLCFYACESDADCAETMSCEHGNTVCEYP